MEMLALADLEGMTEEQIKEHIRIQYEADIEEIDQYDIMIAYESVGDYGCDSSSFFLLRDKETGKYFGNHGSHCSCYGFEGQWEPEEINLSAYANMDFYIALGGYDESPKENSEAVSDYIKNLIKELGI